MLQWMFHWKVITFSRKIDFNPTLPHMGFPYIRQWLDQRSTHTPFHRNFQLIWLTEGTIWLKTDWCGSFNGELEGTTLLLSPRLMRLMWKELEHYRAIHPHYSIIQPSITAILMARKSFLPLFFCYFSFFIFFFFCFFFFFSFN